MRLAVFIRYKRHFLELGIGKGKIHRTRSLIEISWNLITLRMPEEYLCCFAAKSGIVSRRSVSGFLALRQTKPSSLHRSQVLHTQGSLS